MKNDLIIRIKGSFTPKYWGVQFAVLVDGLVQKPRIDMQLGPFSVVIYFGEL